MQFVDLKKQYELVKEDVLQRLDKVLSHGGYIMGPEVQALEKKLADYVSAKHCITVASGTDALLIAMMALGIQPGDEVISTPFTFIATAEMIRLLNAIPVFVDIDPKTYNIQTNLIEAAITPKTKMIIPINLYGQCADYDAIDDIAKKYQLPIVEDAAQSFGATYKKRSSCNLGLISCTSFFPAKPLGCYGDGGACFTNDDELADKMRKIRNHGQSTRYNHVLLGLNSRLDSMQAAVLLAKLTIFDDELNARKNIAEEYNSLLRDYVTTPYIEPHNQSVFAQYTVQVENRAMVQEILQEKSIPTAIHYPVPLHKQRLFQNEAWNHSNFPASEFCSKRVISLPFHPYLSEKDLNFITSEFIEALSLTTESAQVG